MDDGEVDFSDHDIFCGATNLVCDDDHSAGGSASAMESFLDEILKSTHTCTHTHTCNPPGPDKTHTHTCFHTHTQLFASPEEASSHKEEDHHHRHLRPKNSGTIDSTAAATGNAAAAAATDTASPQQSSKKRPLGNREAVRKYREKKKAHAVYLEEQVAQLKAINQQLVKRLQGQAALEAEVARLRALLAEFRGRIDAELGCFPYKRPCMVGDGDGAAAAAANGGGGAGDLQALSGGFYLNAVSVPCDAEVPCFHHGDSTSSQPEFQKAVACDYVSESCQGTVGGASLDSGEGL